MACSPLVSKLEAFSGSGIVQPLCGRVFSFFRSLPLWRPSENPVPLAPLAASSSDESRKNYESTDVLDLLADQFGQLVALPIRLSQGLAMYAFQKI